jgi:ParB family chromosome partitioning protein
MTTSAAENLAGRAGEKDKDKDKVEKRRALGRGLESLLPGPRVVTAPPRPLGQAIAGTIQAVAEDATEVELRSAGQPGAAVPTTASISSTSTALPTAPVTASSAAVGGETGAPAPQESETITIQPQAESRVPGNLVINIELDAIDKNPYQTRYDFNPDSIEELADSIRVNGVVQPVVVRPAEEEGRYILILGERRCRASKLAGRATVPAMVKRVSEQQAAEMTIIENLQREDLNCMEQAEAFRVLSQEFHLTQQQIGDRVGMSRVSVANYMRLLKLTQPTMEHVIAGRISFSEAKELLKLEDPITIEQAAERAVKEQMRFEQVEAMVMRMQGWLNPIPGDGVPERKKSGARWVDPNVKAAQSDLERMLGVRVRIRDRKGKGKIVIEYHTVDDYERVVEMIRGKK